ncbi:hypothetical protein EV421DRAFT_2018600 [Armillaria borealis]|uniref:Uncharacterized protein n=1 Tax=Armillaria borealis TaxID=47425 RepID=A0AA39JNC0_9AGAR|nr:hypothetical protein EV421DRAFT_2018600 [Armillaria borealis]
MIFNVNAAAVAALALTMAVHAAPSPVAHVLQDVVGCDNVNDGHDADFGNHRDDVDRSAAIRVSVNDATSRGDHDDDSRTDSNRGSDESRRTDSNRGSDNSRSESNRASDSRVDARILTDSNRSDESRHSDSNRASDSLVNADILTDSNRASDESRRTDSNHASDNSRTESNRASDSLVDARVLTSNRANDDSRHTDSSHASDSLVNADILTTHRNTDQSRITDDDCDDVVDARNRDARETRDNSRCDDCTPEVRHAGGVLRRGVTALSQITHVLRVEHLTERCSPEESARRCGPDCNGFIGGWNRDKSLFDLLFLDKATHDIPSEFDALLSQQREDGWEPQFHYEC